MIISTDILFFFSFLFYTFRFVNDWPNDPYYFPLFYVVKLMWLAHMKLFPPKKLLQIAKNIYHT